MNQNVNFVDVETPKMGRTTYTNTYWLCKDGDPMQALFYGTSPQCNCNKKVCEWFLQKDIYKGVEGLEIVFMPVSYVPQR